MSHKIEKPMSETTIKDQVDKEKRHREDSPTADVKPESVKRRELSPPESASAVSQSELPKDEKDAKDLATTADIDPQAEDQGRALETAKPEADEDKPATNTSKKFGFGQAKGFASLAGSSSAFGSTNSNGSAFSSMFSKTNQNSGFSSLLSSAPSSSIFSQETSADAHEKDKDANDAAKDEDEDEVEAPVDDDQYVVVKGLEKTTVPTGEEEETCIHLIRAKLYAIDPRNTEAGWKERGTGNLRVLRDSTKRTRLVMRADAVLRVILNMPLHPKYKLEDGGVSMGEKTLRLFGVEDGIGTWLAIRVGSQKSAEELKQVIQNGMDETPSSSEVTDTTKSDNATIESKVEGIVPHDSYVSSTKVPESNDPLDSVEASEIANEKVILAEKAESESTDLAKDS